MNVVLTYGYAVIVTALIATTVSAARPVMNLRINDAIITSGSAGQPLVLTAIVLDEQAQTLQSRNAANRIERQSLAERRAAGEFTQEQYQAALADLDTAPVPSYTFGTAEAPWHRSIIWRVRIDSGQWQALPWNLHLLLIPPAEDAGVVNGIGVVAAAYGLDPGDAERLRSGQYVLQAALPPGVAPGIADTLWSNEVTITLGPQGKGSPGYEELRWLAFYWLRRGEYQRAHDLATQLGQQRPDDINLYEMRGDALAGLGQPEQAAAQYARGIELYYAQSPRPYEPPDMLIDKLNALAGAPQGER